MADEYRDVNKFAFEGGDTAPGTREQIAERNRQAQGVVDALNEHSAKLAEAEAEHYDKLIDMEDEQIDQQAGIMLGQPVPPSFEPVGLRGDRTGRLTRKQAEELRNAPPPDEAKAEAEPAAGEDQKRKK